MTTNYSIIIATYNSEKTIKRTLNSMLAQTFKNFEVILIDGLSNDSTVDIIKEFEIRFKLNSIPLLWISEKDSGIYDAWNKGLKMVASQWISFLGSDDTYYPDALEVYNSEIIKNPDINFICSKVAYIDSDDNILRIIRKPYSYSQTIRYMDFAHVGSFHHKNLFLTYGDFDTKYKIVGDYDFFMKCGRNIRAAFINKITTKMLNTGISNNNINKTLREVLRVQLIHKKTSILQIYFEYYFAILRISKNRIMTKLKTKKLKN